MTKNQRILDKIIRDIRKMSTPKFHQVITFRTETQQENLGRCRITAHPHSEPDPEWERPDKTKKRRTTMINENKLAQEVAQAEGGRKNLSIGQIKEVMRLVLEKLATQRPSEVLALVEKHDERLRLNR